MKISKNYIFLCLLVHLVSVKLNFRKKIGAMQNFEKLSLVSRFSIYEGH